MVDVSDVQGYREKFENQRERLEDADIDDRDREAIRRWVVHLRANDPSVGSLGTVVGHLNRIRLASERAHCPLVEMCSVEDVNALKLHLEDRYGLSEGTCRNYMKAVRKFSMWFFEEEWPETITIGAPPERKHDPDEEITADELDAMLDAAAAFDSAAREKALIALLRDTGLRIGAILSLQLRHVDFDGQRGTIHINEAANVKGASGPKPVTWSRGYVANWLDVHPRPDNPDAALIHKTRGWDDDEDGALRQQYAARRVSEIAEQAGLDADRINCKLFRGTAISSWIRDDNLNEQKIKHRVDWTEDSSQFGVYSRVSDEEMNDAIFDAYDIGEAREDGGPTLETCPQCRTPLRGSERFCPGCASPLTSSAVDIVETVDDATFEHAVGSDASDRDVLEEFRRRFKSSPEFRARFIDDAHD